MDNDFYKKLGVKFDNSRGDFLWYMIITLTPFVILGVAIFFILHNV